MQILYNLYSIEYTTKTLYLLFKLINFVFKFTHFEFDGPTFGPTCFQISNYIYSFKVFVSDESKSMSVLFHIMYSLCDELDFKLISICFNTITMEMLHFIDNNLVQVLEFTVNNLKGSKKFLNVTVHCMECVS